MLLANFDAFGPPEVENNGLVVVFRAGVNHPSAAPR